MMSMSKSQMHLMLKHTAHSTQQTRSSFISIPNSKHGHFFGSFFSRVFDPFESQKKISMFIWIGITDSPSQRSLH